MLSVENKYFHKLCAYRKIKIIDIFFLSSILENMIRKYSSPCLFLCPSTLFAIRYSMWCNGRAPPSSVQSWKLISHFTTSCRETEMLLLVYLQTDNHITQPRRLRIESTMRVSFHVSMTRDSLMCVCKSCNLLTDLFF